MWPCSANLYVSESTTSLVTKRPVGGACTLPDQLPTWYNFQIAETVVIRRYESFSKWRMGATCTHVEHSSDYCSQIGSGTVLRVVDAGARVRDL
jgi:hypothetical protein